MIPVIGDLIIYVNIMIAAVLTLVYSTYKHDRNAIRLVIMWVTLFIIVIFLEAVPLIALVLIKPGAYFWWQGFF